jgi:serine/threonine protein kinase/Tfp pilus assembly protein PilF
MGQTVAIKCPKCHSENPETLKFCGECGTQLPPLKEVPWEFTETLKTSIKELTRGSTFAGRYDIIEELGKGGMGKVYRVFDKKIDEEIALKLIKPEIAADQETIKRFSNELKLARKIAHRNVCKMYELLEDEGTHFITMEYVTGEDLKSFIRRSRQLTVGTAVAIARQVAEGLTEAHRQGVVHRDLKPGNIMIDKEGNAKIMDFGIARSLSDKGITAAGVLIGTPEYMSPEQVEGKEVDQRSDVYSLGVILYEMITGRRPFEGDTALSIAVKHKVEKPPDPKQFNPNIPEELSRLILKCLEKEKERRFQRADEILSALVSIESGTYTTGRATIETHDAEKTSEVERKKSIAVLPFANLSPEKEQDYFCDGLTEEIINALSHIRQLRVVARTSAFAFKGKEVDIREVGAKLNVDTVLEGSVRKAGHRLRITAQLINVSDGYHLWSERYDRDLEDVFLIQDDISLAIVNNLKVELLGKEKEALARRPPVSLDAYNAYLQGRYLLYKETRSSISRAIEYFQQAITLSPDYALAYAGIAGCYHRLGLVEVLPAKDMFPKAKEFALKAIEIDPSISEAHSILAVVKMDFEWDWEGAEKAFEKALELNPNSAVSLSHHSMLLMAIGKPEEGLKEVRKARAVDPLLDASQWGMGIFLLRAGRLEEARAQFKKSVDLEPDRAHSHWLLGQSLVLESKYDDGIQEIQKACSLSSNNPMILAGLGWGYAAAGRIVEAEKVIEELKERSRQEYIRPYFLAKIYAALGRLDLAFEWLEKAYEEHDTSLVFILNDESLLNLHSDPRFNLLLRKMRLIK